MTLSIDGILVPQGPEYRTVRRAITKTSVRLPIIAIPVGRKPAGDYLKNWLRSNDPQNYLNNFLLCGLCGSLSDRYNIGDVVIYRNYTYSQNADRPLQLECESEFISYLYAKFARKPILVRGLTEDRVVSSVFDKVRLARIYQVDVVDMEGFAVGTVLQELGNRKLATIRVISDDLLGDLPDLSSAIDDFGNLLPLPLAIAMLKQPLAATRLISGSLRSLKILERAILEIFA
ncbi:MAG: hypothetical protein ACFBSE_18755 [Prochloraceae cyanobacterium]